MHTPLRGPELNAALVEAVTTTGSPIAKASGCLVRWENQLLLYTNWHVVTGKQWVSQAERREWFELPKAARPPLGGWMPGVDHSPDALRISVRINGYLKLLRVVSLQSLGDPDDAWGSMRNAWEVQDTLMHGDGSMTSADLVCLRVVDDLARREHELVPSLQTPVRFGYDTTEIGRSYGLGLTDRVFVVGYPMTIGQRTQDPPVWTGGTIATNPHEEWDGPRFLIDSRTRSGQSGSAVITYEPAGRGLPARQQLVGIYSGRIHKSADIGSVWHLEDSLDDLYRHGGPLDPSPVEASGEVLFR